MNYISEVERSIFSYSGRGAVLEPEIYATIAEWEKKEIPIEVVKASIDELCVQTELSHDGARSIDLVKTVVNKNFRAWLTEQ